MSNKKMDSLIQQMENYFECWKQFNHFINIARAKKFGSEDETHFLEMKSVLVQELERILAGMEVSSPTKEEIHSLIGSSPSLRYLSEMSEGALRSLENQWHKIYIGWHAILGQLKVRQQSPETKTGLAALVERFGKQVRGNGGQDVLDGAVLVEVAGDAQRRQLADFVHAGHRAAEHQDRESPLIQLPDPPHQLDTRRVRHAQIERDQIEIRQVRAHVRQQLRDALDHQRAMPRGVERGHEAIPHKWCVGGDENGLACDRCGRHNARMTRSVRCRLYQVLVIIWMTDPDLPPPRSSQHVRDLSRVRFAH